MVLDTKIWALGVLDATYSRNNSKLIPFIDYFFNTLTGLFFFFRATPEVYGDSQARGPIGATAASLRYSHSNAGSEPRLRPTPQVMATPDP